MSCKNCGHLKRCHEQIVHHDCRLGSSICSSYVKWKKGDIHYMQEFYNSNKQGKSWKRGTKNGNGRFYGVLKNDEDLK